MGPISQAVYELIIKIFGLLLHKINDQIRSWHEQICNLAGVTRILNKGQVITDRSIFGMQLLVPALDTCFWHKSPHLDGTITYQFH